MRFDVREIAEIMENFVPFNRFLGIKVKEVRKGFVSMVLPFRQEFVGDPLRPALHGGVITTLADTCGGAAVWSSAGRRDRVSTVDLRIDYLLPGPLEDIVCEATVLRIGNRVGVATMKVFPSNNPETIVSYGTGVYNVRRSE